MAVVVDATAHEGAVGIAFEEINHHFLPDPRNVHASPRFAGPILRDAHPARAVFIGLPFAIPMELEFDTAVFVGPDFLTLLADDHCRLRTVYEWFGRFAQWAKRFFARDRFEIDLEPVLGIYA